MQFLVSVQHKACCFTYVIKAEPDGIFIAFPQKRGGLREKIFLIKTDRQWMGDADDKLLVQQIGRQIEICSAAITKTTKQAGSTGIRRQKQAVAGLYRKAKNTTVQKKAKAKH